VVLAIGSLGKIKSAPSKGQGGRLMIGNAIALRELVPSNQRGVGRVDRRPSMP
jgi:hypothetical protein